MRATVDKKTSLLICLGAAVPANGAALLRHYHGEAPRLGLDPPDVDAAFAHGRKIKTGANIAIMTATAETEVIAAPENLHAYLYCHEGPRAATMWLIKRVRQDGWTLDRAMAEAESLGLKRPELKQFAAESLAGSRY